MLGRLAHIRVLTVAAVTAAGALIGAGPTAAQDVEPTAAVAMGDSYIAGESGRWLGNSSNSWGDRNGTDRAAEWRGWYWRYVEENVYGDTYASGCNRSDVAPIVSAGLAVDTVANLACSGARTINLRSAANGGREYRGEPPQADQLAAIAAGHDVEVVVVSVGGNDLGFAGMNIDCVTRYVTSTRWWPDTCAQAQQRNVDGRLPAALEGVRGVLADVRSVLDAHGDAGARIILQSYPKPVTDSAANRYRQTGWNRTFTGGCPFWDVDLDWATGTLVPSITEGLRSVAADTGVEFLDLTDALRGHEPCAQTAAHGTGGIDGAGAEWVRFVTPGITQGDAGESLHPNAHGQRALGRCIALAVDTDPSPDVCVNTPGEGTTGMKLLG